MFQKSSDALRLDWKSSGKPYLYLPLAKATYADRQSGQEIIPLGAGHQDRFALASSCATQGGDAGEVEDTSPR